jgi:hypothetical protein
MASASPVDVDLWIEKVSPNGVIATHSTKISPTQKVEAMIQRLAPGDWTKYRLAYGVFELMHNAHGDSRSEFLGLQWADKRLSPEYNPSFGELFQDISLQPGQRYFLLMSRLGEGLKDPECRDYPGNRPSFAHCLQRYAPLHASFRAPAGAAITTPHAPAPAPSRKRPASPPSDSTARRQLPADLAALRALLLEMPTCAPSTRAWARNGPLV